MSAGDFFNRWSRNKAEIPAAPDTVATPVHEPAPELPPPTLEDVAALGHDADFSRFVKPGVDETVRRSAMKKLFTDPHFNVMDGLDIYIDDYNTFEPLPAAMLAMLAHAKPLLDPLGHLQQPAMTMLDRLVENPPAAAANPLPASADETQSDAPAQEAAPAESTDLAHGGQAIEHPVVNTAEVPTAEAPAAVAQRDPAPPEDDHTIQSL